jgi:hypothetical protein
MCVCMYVCVCALCLQCLQGSGISTRVNMHVCMYVCMCVPCAYNVCRGLEFLLAGYMYVLCTSMYIY